MADPAHFGAILLSLLLAGALTFVLGSILLLLLQRAILRNMMSIGALRTPPPEDQRPRRPAAALALAVVPPAGERGETGRLLWRHGLAHTAAGLAFATLSTLLQLLYGGLELLPLRTVVVIWAYAWPTVLVLGILAGPDRPAQATILLGYLGALALLCVFAELGGTPAKDIGGSPIPGILQPALIWLFYAAPTFFLILFLNRTIRAIGPLVLVFVFILLLGGQLGMTVLSDTAIIDTGLRIALELGIGGAAYLWWSAVPGILAAIWPAWRAVTFLRDRYAAKRSSDLLLTAGAIWMLQALLLGFSLMSEQGALAATAAVLPLIAWWLILHAALTPLVRSANSRPPSRLLLLRVFGFGRRSRRLLDLIGTHWRLRGSIDLIAAPDLASRTVEPATFLEFVRGRLQALFIRTPVDLEKRLRAIDHRPDPDARFRVNQLFCADDMWREGVIRLMRDASLVVMDLRGFSPQRRGCVYEIETLLDIVPLIKLIFLVDHTSDRKGLDTVLSTHWQRLTVDSPNAALPQPTLRLLDVSDRSDVAAVRTLMTIADAGGTACPATRLSSPPL